MESNAPFSQQVLITPEMAKDWLIHNTKGNRQLSRKKVVQYVGDMKSGRWKPNTFEMIKISITGKIIDGQHRLNAVVEAGMSILFHVAFNVPDNVFDVIDTGKSRCPSDTFKVAGIKFENVIPAIIQRYNSLLTGNTIKGGYIRGNQLTNSELLELYRSDEKLWNEVAAKAVGWYRTFNHIIPPSWFGALYAFFSTKNSENAKDFLDQLASGMDIENNVILFLRNILTKDAIAIRKMTGGTRIGYILKAWNIYRTNKRVKILRFDPEKEETPIAI